MLCWLFLLVARRVTTECFDITSYNISDFLCNYGLTWAVFNINAALEFDPSRAIILLGFTTIFLLYILYSQGTVVATLYIGYLYFPHKFGNSVGAFNFNFSQHMSKLSCMQNVQLSSTRSYTGAHARNQPIFMSAVLLAPEKGRKMKCK